MLFDRTKIGIVIPCYNEALRLPVVELDSFLKEYPDICFCFVNDGSLDNTQRVLEYLRAARSYQVEIIKLNENKGKAEAIRRGIHHLISCRKFAILGFGLSNFQSLK